MTTDKTVAKWMLHEKQIVILYELVASKKRYVTGLHLSYATNLSLKTIKKEVESLNALLDNIHVSIVSSPGEGYRIVANDDELYQEFRESLVDSYHRGRYFTSAQHGRVHYIIRRILSHASPLYLDDLADECFVSKSVINKDMQSVKNELSKYNISVTNHTNRGLVAIGTEWAKRVCMIQEHRIYLNYIGVINRDYDLEFEKELFLEQKQYYAIDDILFRTFQTSGIAIPRNCYKKILLMIVLSINRSQHQSKLSLDAEVVAMFVGTRCHALVGDMLNEIKQISHTFTELDQMAITIFIMCLSTYEFGELVNKQIHLTIKQETDKLIDYIHAVMPLWGVIDSKLKADLEFQYFNVYCRHRCKVYLEDELFPRIADHGLLSLDLCQLVGKYFLEHHNFNPQFLQETIQFYYVFSDFLNRKYALLESLRYHRIIVVNKAGFYTSKNLANKIKNYIKNPAFEIVPVTYMELFSMQLGESDLLLIDFIDRRVKQLHVRTATLEYFWGEQDISEFIHLLTQNRVIDMRELMTPQCVHIGEHIASRKALLKFIETNIIQDVAKKSTIIAELEEREKYLSAAKTNQVVVLRSNHDYIGESRFHVIIPQTTFLWSGKPCSMILFYNVKDNLFDAHYFLNRVIANLMHNAEFLENRPITEITYESILKQVRF